MSALHNKLGLHKVLAYIPLNGILNAPYQARVKRAVNIADLRRIAQSRVHKIVFDYLDTGSDDEITLRRNKDAYCQLDMHYKVLSGIRPPLDLSTTLFGERIRIPFFPCPTGAIRGFHHEGETAVAAVAEEFGTVYSLSTMASTGFEDVCSVHKEGLPKIFQLYVWKDRQLIKDLLTTAKDHGFTVLTLTADVSWMGNRERDKRNGFDFPPTMNATKIWQALQKPAWAYDYASHEPPSLACLQAVAGKNSSSGDDADEPMFQRMKTQYKPEFDWKDAEWLLGEWGTGTHTDNGRRLSTALKGVIRPDDAARALATGFDAVWISNHGGRQLETSPAPITVLPAIRETVGPNVELIVDGGIQRGTDITKALALGANAVGIGKPYLWGLAAGGRNGVRRAFDVLRDELDRAMGLLGTPTVADLRREGPSLIRQRPPSIRDYPDMYAGDRGYGGGII